MALYLNFINVIVPITNIEKHFNVSFDVFFDSYSRDGRYKAVSGLKYYDKYLFATGHMDGWYVDEIVESFEKEGLTSTVKIDGKEHYKDLCVAGEGMGLQLPCDWLKYNEKEQSVWLKGTKKGKIVHPYDMEHLAFLRGGEPEGFA
jgi:hypothetical protein